MTNTELEAQLQDIKGMMESMRGDIESLLADMKTIMPMVLFPPLQNAALNPQINALEAKLDALADVWLLSNQADYAENLDFQHKRPFDILSMSDDGCVFRYVAESDYIRLANVSSAITLEGLTLNDDGNYELSGVEATTYIFAKLNRASGHTYIVAADAFPTDDDPELDYKVIHPLWYIPFGSTKIDWNSAVDLRCGIIYPAMA